MKKLYTVPKLRELPWLVKALTRRATYAILRDEGTYLFLVEVTGGMTIQQRDSLDDARHLLETRVREDLGS